jgi:hypothetical protein
MPTYKNFKPFIWPPAASLGLFPGCMPDITLRYIHLYLAGSQYRWFLSYPFFWPFYYHSLSGGRGRGEKKIWLCVV